MKVTDEAQAFLAPILAAYEALDTICVFDSSVIVGVNTVTQPIITFHCH